MKTTKRIAYLFAAILLIACKSTFRKQEAYQHRLPANMLDYTGTPASPNDRTALVFSDQGAWFGYGFSDDTVLSIGFSGPFLMTQENGAWCSPMLSRLYLKEAAAGYSIDLKTFKKENRSYNSHLEQVFTNNNYTILQRLYFSSAHTALITTTITNTSNKTVELSPVIKGDLFLNSLKLHRDGDIIKITSTKSNATGYIQVIGDPVGTTEISDSQYTLIPKKLIIKPRGAATLLIAHTFIFPGYDLQKEQQLINTLAQNHLALLAMRIKEKEQQLQQLSAKTGGWDSTIYRNLLSKTVLTLQNNWRIAAGGLRHGGLFPSYHFQWFHGFWAWDSWKHAVALVHYFPSLAKEQIQAMYDYQEEDGFIPDCIFRDTTIQQHNYRNTKPPLSAWAAWNVYKNDSDIIFLKELYPKIKKQHDWWYTHRDHDKDGICEYGSADGTIVAAKWESGMDNAVRFDESQILKNAAHAYSLNQESVDLNAYLYAEKQYLGKIAEALGLQEDTKAYDAQSDLLKQEIQQQFFDSLTGWFYDTSMDGKKFIDIMGCEGWIPLWAHIATPSQAEAVKKNMMNPRYFNTKVPLQTLSAADPKFKPDGGYWRGPNWIDQTYFGIMGLKNYGYQQEAQYLTYQLMHHAEGVLSTGMPIRENYNPITGEGLESSNFSWSAAHYLLLLLNE